MIEYAMLAGLTIVVLALILNAWRLALGPSMMDRVLAADTMVINTIALIILYGMFRQNTNYFEAALLFALFGFTSTVAYCRFVLRGDIIE